MSAIVFTGGGTGGHVYPGLAVYEYLTPSDQRRVCWIGSRHGVERSILRGSGIPFTAIPAGKLRRYLSRENVTDLFRVGAGVLAALRTLRSLDADVVFSKGGYVAVPVVLAARFLGIPVIIHESDSDPGLATRLTVPLADFICVPYRETAQKIARRYAGNVVITGNPVRNEFVTASAESALSLVGLEDTGGSVLLVTGGSLGAQQLNEFVLDQIDPLTKFCTVVHQTGTGGKTMIPRIVERASSGRYAGAPTYNREFAPLLRRADLVVCRAGAGTLWELAVTGTPAILIPLPVGASRGDQIRNARRYAQSGAAVVPRDEECTPQGITALVREILSDSHKLDAMRHATREFARGNSAESIAGLITRIIQ